MKKYQTIKVFTPNKAAELLFVERQKINDRLVNALITPGKQVVIYGSTGSGKTTLIRNKLHQLYPNHITSWCTVFTTAESLLLHAFDTLNLYYTSTTSLKKNSSFSAKLAQDYFGIKSAIEASTSSEKQLNFGRLVPPQLTAQRLAEFCGAAGCCWVLEDFHKVPVSEKKGIAQSMKVFMDAASDYEGVKVVAIGAVGSASEVIEYDNDMRTRVAEIAVPLMAETELLELLQRAESLLNVRFGALKQTIVSLSSGLAAVCHELGLNSCLAAGIYETAAHPTTISNDIFVKALEEYLHSSSMTIKAAFDIAVRIHRERRFDNTRLIIRALSYFGSDGATHAKLLKRIKVEESGYPAGNLTKYLKELQSAARGEIVRYESSSGKYFFKDPLYLAYSQCLLAPRSPTEAPVIKLSDFAFPVDVTDIATPEVLKWRAANKTSKSD